MRKVTFLDFVTYEQAKKKFKLINLEQVQIQSIAMAKPPTVVGKASQNASGRNIINSVIVISDTRKSIQ